MSEPKKASFFDIFREMSVLLKLASAFAELKKLNTQGAPMSKYLPIIVTVIATVSSAIAFPNFVAAHATAFAILNAAAQALHAILPGVFSAPVQQ